MRILLLYHYFYPDKCVSARVFSDFAIELSKYGNKITVFTGNRLLREDSNLISLEQWNGITIYRHFHPSFYQGHNIGRILNSIILQMNWLRGYLKHRGEFDVIIAGTDPQFSYLLFPLIKTFDRRVTIAHWVFDLYPEAILVNSPLWMRLLALMMKPIAKLSYHCVDLMVDIGSCMRKRLDCYQHHAAKNTLTPWALRERESLPHVEPTIRKKLFGEAKIGLLYSGTIGYAHDILPFISLARECRKRKVDAAFCFAGYGNGFKKQTSLITQDDTNIRTLEFVNEKELEERLSAADIHLVSLKEGWEGIVVPSKFFGAIAIGRPVIFSGSTNSCIAEWCMQYHLGTILDNNTADWIQFRLNNPIEFEREKEICIRTYNREFSKNNICNKWQASLAKIVQDRNKS